MSTAILRSSRKYPRLTTAAGSGEFAMQHALRLTDDPALRQRLEELAVEFAKNIGGERDLGMSAAPLAAIAPKPDSSNINAHN